MWLGYTLAYLLAVVLFLWVLVTQLLIPLLYDRPVFPMIRLWKQQKAVKEVREDLYKQQLESEISTIVRDIHHEQVFVAKNEVFTTLSKECSAFYGLMSNPEEDRQAWHVLCQASYVRLRGAMKNVDEYFESIEST